MRKWASLEEMFSIVFEEVQITKNSLYNFYLFPVISLSTKVAVVDHWPVVSSTEHVVHHLKLNLKTTYDLHQS